MKSFVKSPIGYCTLVWMFHGWTVKKKKANIFTSTPDC